MLLNHDLAVDDEVEMERVFQEQRKRKEERGGGVGRRREENGRTTTEEKKQKKKSEGERGKEGHKGSWKKKRDKKEKRARMREREREGEWFFARKNEARQKKKVTKRMKEIASQVNPADC